MPSNKNHLSPKTLAIVALITVAASYTFLGIASRLLSEGFAPMTQVYIRLLGAALLTAIFFYSDIRWRHMMKLPKKDYLPLLLMGTVGFSIAVYFITLGVLNTSLLNVAVILATMPFFSYILSILFLKSTINLRQIMLLLVSFIGVAIVATKSFTPELGQFGKGELFVLLSAVTTAVFFVARKKLSDHLNNSEITLFVLTIASLTSFLIAAILGESLSLGSFTNSHVLIGLVIGAGLNVLVNKFEIFAFHHLDAGFGSQILMTENIFAPLLGFLLYRELFTLPELVGAIVIIGSVYLANKYSTT